jgi:hypothetical protein
MICIHKTYAIARIFDALISTFGEKPGFLKIKYQVRSRRSEGAPDIA